MPFGDRAIQSHICDILTTQWHYLLTESENVCRHFRPLSLNGLSHGINALRRPFIINRYQLSSSSWCPCRVSLAGSDFAFTTHTQFQLPNLRISLPQTANSSQKAWVAITVCNSCCINFFHSKMQSKSPASKALLCIWLYREVLIIGSTCFWRVKKSCCEEIKGQHACGRATEKCYNIRQRRPLSQIICNGA